MTNGDDWQTVISKKEKRNKRHSTREEQFLQDVQRGMSNTLARPGEKDDNGDEWPSLPPLQNQSSLPSQTKRQARRKSESIVPEVTSDGEGSESSSIATAFFTPEEFTSREGSTQSFEDESSHLSGTAESLPLPDRDEDNTTPRIIASPQSQRSDRSGPSIVDGNVNSEQSRPENSGTASAQPIIQLDHLESSDEDHTPPDSIVSTRKTGIMSSGPLILDGNLSSGESESGSREAEFVQRSKQRIAPQHIPTNPSTPIAALADDESRTLSHYHPERSTTVQKLPGEDPYDGVESRPIEGMRMLRNNINEKAVLWELWKNANADASITEVETGQMRNFLERLGTDAAFTEDLLDGSEPTARLVGRLLSTSTSDTSNPILTLVPAELGEASQQYHTILSKLIHNLLVVGKVNHARQAFTEYVNAPNASNDGRPNGHYRSSFNPCSFLQNCQHPPDEEVDANGLFCHPRYDNSSCFYLSGLPDLLPEDSTEQIERYIGWLDYLRDNTLMIGGPEYMYANFNAIHGIPPPNGDHPDTGARSGSVLADGTSGYHEYEQVWSNFDPHTALSSTMQPLASRGASRSQSQRRRQTRMKRSQVATLTQGERTKAHTFETVPE